jgi:hypothetical protein
MARNFAISVLASLPLGFVWGIVKREAELPGVVSFGLFALAIWSGCLVFIHLEERRRTRLPQGTRRR